MELEVSKKVRAAIKAKLLELGCHVDDELPDYIMVLIANRRSTVQMESDLSLFLNENNKKFVSWLTQVLQKLEQVTATSTLEEKAKKVSDSSVKVKDAIEKPMKLVQKTIKKAKKAGDGKLKKVAIASKKKNQNKLDGISVIDVEKEVTIISNKSLEPMEVDVVEDIKPHVVPQHHSNEQISEITPLENKSKVTMILKKPDQSKAIQSATFFQEAEELSISQSLSVLSDAEETLEDVLQSIIPGSNLATKVSSSGPKSSQDSSRKLRTVDSVNQSDELILNTEENEFADLDELRRIALESQQKKRQGKQTTSKKVIKNIIMSPLKKEQQRETRKSRSRSPAKVPRRRESPKRDLRSPKRSVFERLANSRHRRQRSDSRSPVRRRLSSTIGTVIHRSEEYDPVRPSVSSVIKVTDRPKRDLKMNSKLLMMAVADARKSIIRNDQHVPTDAKSDRKQKPSEENKKPAIITNRRFNDFPEVQSEEFYEPQEASVRRKSVKERLGVKREGATRRSIKDRLGLGNNPQKDPMEEEPFVYYNQSDYNIVINVNDGGPGHSNEKRNVTLADMKMATMNRISIQINNSEEDDTSEEDDSSSGSDRDVKPEIDKKKSVKERSTTGSDSENFEVSVSIDNDDKLPEVPSDNEYIVEEIEVDENERKGSPVSVQEQQKSFVSTDVEGFEETTFSMTVNDENKALMNVLAPTITYPVLPDLRGRLSNPKPLAKVRPLSNPTKCVFWPKCSYKDNCQYEHPVCRFNPCSNSNCFYKHERLTPTNETLTPKKLVCKFYPKCTSMSCSFFHPSPCRFGLGCTDVKCQNYHPGVTVGMQKLKAKGGIVIPKANELKWVKK